MWSCISNRLDNAWFLKVHTSLHNPRCGEQGVRGDCKSPCSHNSRGLHSGHRKKNNESFTSTFKPATYSNQEQGVSLSCPLDRLRRPVKKPPLAHEHHVPTEKPVQGTCCKCMMSGLPLPRLIRLLRQYKLHLRRTSFPSSIASYSYRHVMRLYLTRQTTPVDDVWRCHTPA